MESRNQVKNGANPKSHKSRKKEFKMSQYSTFRLSATEIRDPELKRLLEQVTDMFKVEAYQAISARAQNKPFKFSKLKVGVKKALDYDSVGEVIDSWIAKKDAATIQSLVSNNGTRAFLARNPSTIMLNVDIRSNNYILNQIDLKRNFSYINDKLIFERFANLFGVETKAPSTSSTTTIASPAIVLRLNLKRVKCIDETDPEWGGKDSIALGGVTVDDKENLSKIKEFHVGDFNDGDQKSYSPAKVLKEFKLDNINPSTFFGFISLAEKDSGGFSSFLNDLYNAIKAELTLIFAAVGAAAGAAIGSAIGGAIGTAIAGPLGTIIGVVAGLVLGALIGWLVSILKDDIFEPQITGIHLNANAAFTGPLQRLRYRDFGGYYLVEVFWSAS